LVPERGKRPLPSNHQKSLVDILEEEIMDKDRVVGSEKQVKGKVKEAVGKAVGDAKLEAQGKADKIEGKVQNTVGGIKDTLKGK
jgi:uncharacterized protein YjbJ (UPF0337 family)